MSAPDALTLAHDYLAPPAFSFWKWDDAGDVVVWDDGTTIAFRAELCEVLNRLAPAGLPPLNAVLLLLAACRDSWQDSAPGLEALVSLLTSVTRLTFPGWFPQVLRRLDAVGVLRSELRSSPEAKAVLAEVVFEGWRNRIVPHEAEQIVRVLADGPTPAILARQGVTRYEWQDLAEELQGLDRGLQHVDPAQLELRRRTGLDELVEPAKLELDAVERTRRLIASLLDDEDLGGLARVARQLMAAVHLPRSISDHEDLPVGGVTDITNRGPLDRLLLSELANDDLTLAVRVALREALYLRREAPPRNPPQHRAVLLDAGLRMWGVPRVFATGVGLALAATATRAILVDVYRARGAQVVPVDLTTREGLIRHLEALEPEAHPGDALAAFLAAASEQQTPREAILVTGEDAAADPAFRRAAAEAAVATLYLATVNRDGEFRLVVRSPRGNKPVCQARLDLKELLQPRAARRAPPLMDRRRTADLPAILSAQPFPLRLPHDVDPERVWPIGARGLLAVTHDRRLMHWSGDNQAARQLTDRLPTAGKVVWYAPTHGAAPAAAVIGKRGGSGYHFVSEDWQSDEVRTVPLQVDAQEVTGFAWSGGALLAFFGRSVQVAARVDVINADTGTRVASQDIGRPIFQRYGRIVRLADGWYCLSWDGSTMHQDRVLDASTERRLELTAVFESATGEGVFGVTARGHIYSSSDEQVRRVALPAVGPVLVRAVADDGRSVLLARAGAMPRLWCVELPDMNVTPVPVSCDAHPRAALVRSAIGHFVRSRSLPWHFHTLIGSQTEGLTLIGRHGHGWRLELDEPQDRLWLRRVDAESAAGVRRALQPLPGAAETGFRLRTARWDDGSRAWIDSRGLLHLRSSDAGIPEVTLVLYHSRVAGWCSDGRVFGQRYFIGDATPASAAGVFHEVLQRFLVRLR